MRAFHPEAVDSILVLRLYFIGDVLLSTPVLEALGTRFPDARLAVVVKKRARDVLVGNPFVDEIIVYDEVPRYHSPIWTLRLARRLRAGRYFLSVDLTGDWRSSWMVFAANPAFRVGFNHAGFSFLLDRKTPYTAPGHVVDHLLSTVEPLGARTETPAPRMYLSEQEKREAAELLSGVGLKPDVPLAALAPGANWRERRWPASRFAALATALRDAYGAGSVILGGAGDAELAREASADGAAISLVGRTSLRQAAAVASLSSVFVGNDSGLMHMAASVGTPVVGLFGPNTPAHFSPRGAPSRIIYKNFDCSPCAQNVCSRSADSCMTAISVDEVMEALRSLMEEVGGLRAANRVERRTG